MFNFSVIKNKQLMFYARAAKDFGASIEIINPRYLLEFKKNNRKWSVFWATPSINSLISSKISKSKNVSSGIMHANNIPVPKMRVFLNYPNALKYFKKSVVTHKLVVKPDDSLGGKGVTLDPKNKKEFKEAFKEAKKHSNNILIEHLVRGRHYRVIVLGDKVIAVSERVAAFVDGNGNCSLRDLIERENKKRDRTLLSKILIDNELKKFISKQGLELDSIIPQGRRVTIRGNCNMCTGGVTIDKTDNIHSDNSELCINATKVLGLEFGGVDLIINDISQSIYNIGGAINEINDDPDLRLHYCPYKGKIRDVALDVHKYTYERL